MCTIWDWQVNLSWNEGVALALAIGFTLYLAIVGLVFIFRGDDDGKIQSR